MKISRKRDGTYAITDMTHEDLNKLAFAAGTAEAWYYQHPTPHAGADWDERQKVAFHRIERALRAVDHARRPGSVTIQSARGGSQSESDYDLDKLVGLEGWDGERPAL